MTCWILARQISLCITIILRFLFNIPTGLLLEMELREPKRKCRARIPVQQPFPVLNGDATALPTNKALWQVYTGKYSGDFVVVDTADDMIALHTMVIFLVMCLNCLLLLKYLLGRGRLKVNHSTSHG
jgi:hypothetical protein